MKRHLWFGLAFSGLLAASLQAQTTGVRPTGTVPTLGATAMGVKHAVASGINYHDGPVMESTHNVYFIWYGNWSGNTATTILPQFMSNLNGSSYLNTNGSYFDNSRHVTNNLFMSNQIFDSYSQGTTLSDRWTSSRRACTCSRSASRRRC